MNINNEPMQDNSIICESAGCEKKATLKVYVKVGEKGQIVLFLCKKCRPRFSHSRAMSSL
jgi:hypothetical protein